MLNQRVEKGLALGAALLATSVYTLTAARTITWLHNGADSGDLVTAAFTFGVAHPPGYPLYTLLAIPFARLPFVEAAHGVALLSALAAGASVYVLARAGAALIRPLGSGLALAAVPPLAALTLAFGPALWSQATIAEVYALHLLFVSWIVWACVTDDARHIRVAALGFGLGMAHHLSILLLAPGAWIALGPRRQGTRHHAPCPFRPVCLTACHDTRALWLLFTPLIVYAYLPLAALGNPPVNWGNPATLDGFVWLVTAAPYRTYLWGVTLDELLVRLAYTARLLFEQFTFVGVAPIVWGFVQLSLMRRRLWFALGLMFVLIVAYAVGYAARDSFLYLLPAFGISALWLTYGAAQAMAWLGARPLLQGIAVIALALLPISNLMSHYAAMDVSHDRTAIEYAHAALDPLPVDAVLFADGDEALFALLYYRHAVAYRGARSVIVSQGLLQYAWYYNGLRRLMSEVQFQPPEVVTDAHQRAREIIRVTFAEGRAVCFTASSPLLPEFEYEAYGAVQCVVAEKPLTRP